MSNLSNLSTVSGVVLLLPTTAALLFCTAALRAEEARQRLIWADFRRLGRFTLTVIVAVWWVLWDIDNKQSSVESWNFWLPPAVSLGIFLFFCSKVDKAVLRLKWTTADSLRQAWWKLVSFVIPLLMVAAGFELIMGREIRGIAWLLAAGVVSKIGTGFLRRAEGLKLNPLKSGEYRNRALRVARSMEVTLNKVFVVPAGKGHLTNAYGMSDAIALTDSLGQHLNDRQMDYVVAHEVAHVKLRHGRKRLLLVVTIFTIATLSVFLVSSRTIPLRPLIQLLAIFVPVIALYYCSRRFEYSADREAIEFTHAPEIAVQALAKLYQSRELPTASDAFAELFMSHPTFAHRVAAIVNHGQIPADRLPLALEDAGITTGTVDNSLEDKQRTS